ncbi:hypothetical protein PV326_009226 [Microctonus aethiopoides]|nr:hypothetical protein PV326_009226 [Microctonus aethiopoides]
MSESTISNENLLSPKETHKVNIDDIKMNPKRSRDNMSEDESNDKCIKKPRQEMNIEIFHPNTDNNNENKSIIVMDDTDKIRSDKNNDILEKNSAVQDSNEKKQSEIISKKCENMEIDEDKKSSNDKNYTQDNSNNVTEEGKPEDKNESINDPELSIKFISDNNSLESEKNEKKMKLKQNTHVVENTIKESEVETSVLESKLSENSEKHDAEKTENEEIKLLKSSKSDDGEDDNDSNNYENVEGEKSMQKNKITGENLKKIKKKIKDEKKEKSAKNDEKHDQNDSNIDDKSSSSEKCESSTDDDSDGLKYEDCHQIKKTKSKLNVSRKKAAIKLSEKRTNSHDVTVKEKINYSDDKMVDIDNENEDTSLKNKINKSDIDQNESPKTTSNSEESNDDDDINTKKEETKKKNSKFDDEIARLKKYIHAAGIKVKKYDDLWSNCKSNKQKIDRLKLLLEENGISGRPTLQKCEMAKAKREQDREIAELDLKNIISEARITRSMKNCSKKSSSTSSSSQLSSLPQQKIRKRIQIVDSDSE